MDSVMLCGASARLPKGLKTECPRTPAFFLSFFHS
jgi:hypothetical protein